MIKKLDSLIEQLVSQNPWSNVYGVARSLLAIGTIITLTLTDLNLLFRPSVGVTDVPQCIGIGSYISIFCVLSNNLSLAKWISVGILLVVVTGWRPRITGLLHWWISFSFVNSATLIDGGDHVTAVLTLLILPITLLDDRKWHWKNETSELDTFWQKGKTIVATLTHKVIRLQVAIIYLHASLAKLKAVEWQNGTACYYWFTDPVFGHPKMLDWLITPIIQNAYSVSLLTWGVIAFEFILFVLLFLGKKVYSNFLIMGIMFHFGIVLIHGLASFFFAMTAALILYLRPLEAPFNKLEIKKGILVNTSN